MDGFWWNSGIFFCVICTAIGIIGNGLTIAIFAKFKKFRTLFGFYILSLAITDIIISVLVIPVNTTYFIYGGKWDLGNEMCIANTLLTYGNVLTSALMILFIGVNRCVKICYSCEIYCKYFNTKTVTASIIFSWIYAHVIILLMIFGVGGYLKMDENQMSCSLIIEKQWIVILGTYLFILITIIVCYVNIYKTVILSTKKSRRKSCTAAQEVNMRLLKTLVATTTTYLICFIAPVLIWVISCVHNIELAVFYFLCLRRRRRGVVVAAAGMLTGTASASAAGPSGVRTVSGGPLGAPAVPDQGTLQHLARCAELRNREERLLRDVAVALGHAEPQRNATPTHRVNISEVEDLYLRCTSDSMYILDTSSDIQQQLGHQQEVLQAEEEQENNYNHKRRSSTELYREAAAIWGLTCRMSDSCRCLDCQSRYFDCDFEEEERPPDLSASGPVLFDHVLNHPVTCSLL